MINKNKPLTESVARNSLYTLLANIAMVASNWLFFVIIAKFYSSVTLGQFALALSVVSPAFLFASFKVRTLLIVDTDWRFTLENYATARLLANFLVSALIIVTALLMKLAIPTYILVMVLLYKWCDAWSEFCQSYLRRLHFFQLASISLLLRSVLTVIALIMTAYLSTAFYPILLVWVILTATFAVFDSYWLYVYSRKNEQRVFRFTNIISLNAFKPAIHIYKEYHTVALALVISSLFVYLPNFVLSHQLGVTAAGQFSTISYFLVAGGILINSVSQAATPMLAVYYKQGNRAEFISLIRKMCAAGALIGVCGVIVSVWLGEFFLQVFYNQEIAKNADVLNWVMLAAAVRYIYIFLGTGLASLKKFQIQTNIYACGLLTMFIFCIVLIERNGLIGAAQSMLVATLVEFSLYLIVIKRQVGEAFTERGTNP